MKSGAIETAKIDSQANVAAALAAYRADPAVQTAEVDQQVSVATVPNDPQFGSLWAMRNTGQSGGTADADIDADQAWDLQTGSLQTTVAIIDTGIDYTHPDLYKNVWLNQGEVPANLGLVDTDGDGLITFWDLNEPANAAKVTDANRNGRVDAYDVLHDDHWANGQDNDHDGKIDDLIGWDFVNNDNDPFDDNSHGTHVAGTIGAMANNGVGVVGVNWKVQLAALKFLDASGSGYTSDAIDALNYAVSKGIKISNNSWGGSGYSQALASAIAAARAAGDIFVVAAGNSGADNDRAPDYPAAYGYDNIIAVAATDRDDRLASFSNYGATSVDLAAPGVSILSTTPSSTYSTYSGTSMATPHVAGAAALVWSANPSLTYSQIIARILNGADKRSSLTGKVASGGRLNVYNALIGTGGTTPTDTTGPRITASSTNGTTSVSRVRVTFSEAIDPATFTAADVALAGPQGAVAIAAVQVVSGTNNTQFDIAFAAQTAPGTYALNIGPDVRDKAGNPMDQNANGVPGEADDVYRATFAINPASGSATTFTASPAAPIRDFTTTSSTITINQELGIADLNVKLNIAHTWDSDLYVYLQAPDGRRIDLVRYRGGSGDNFTSTTLDDEAATSIASGRTPFSGSYRPEQPLAAFDGQNARGTWTLYVYDGGRRDTGTLNSWSLVITPSAAAAGAAAPAAVGAEGSAAARIAATDAALRRAGHSAFLPDRLPAEMIRQLATLYGATRRAWG